MILTLRVDLDYVPWDSAFTSAWGHAEPAMLLRLLELGRTRGWKFHVFASSRVMEAFPTAIDAVLNEFHDLDLHVGAGRSARDEWERGRSLAVTFGHNLQGISLPVAEVATVPDLPEAVTFVSASSGLEANRPVYFARHWMPGDSTNNWMAVHETMTVSPGPLAAVDPDLKSLASVVDQLVNSRTVRTLREFVRESS